MEETELYRGFAVNYVMESESYARPADSAAVPSAGSDQTSEREVVQRILRSPQFEKSPRLREFLTYITDRTWGGDVDSLKEQLIGHAVFKRQEAYDPVADNIVRVQARQLRLKLEEYFSGEGKDEPLILTVPKGKYVPVFERREAPAPTWEKPGRSSNRTFLIASAAVVVCLALVILVNRTPRITPPGEELFWPWTEIVGGQRRTMIVVSDPTVALIRQLTGRNVTLKDYASAAYPQALFPRDASPQVSGALAFISNQRTTSAADLMIATQIARLLGPRMDQVTVRLARDTRYRELQEANVIVIGTAWGSNPWAEIYERQLNFQSAWDPTASRPIFRNMQPQPGEQPQYMTVARTPNPGRAYAVAALLKHPDHGGSIMLIQGATMEASEGAGTLLTTPASAAQLRQRLGGATHHFEVLLEMEAVSGTATLSNVIATRTRP
jgi:hypothetical protein